MTEGQCHICGTKGEVWYLPIFWRGSEGLSVCHDCRMAITETIRRFADVSNRTRKAVYLKEKRDGNA